MACGFCSKTKLTKPTCPMCKAPVAQPTTAPAPAAATAGDWIRAYPDLTADEARTIAGTTAEAPKPPPPAQPVDVAILQARVNELEAKLAAVRAEWRVTSSQIRAITLKGQMDKLEIELDALRKAIAAQPVAPHGDARADVRQRVVREVASAWDSGNRNVAVALLIGIADRKRKADRLAALAAMDARAQAIGYLTRADEEAREAILDAVAEEVGFDPRIGAPVVEVKTSGSGNVAAKRAQAAVYRATAPQTAQAPRLTVIPGGAAPAPAPAPKALGDGVLPPLRSGDWAELGRRVALGFLTDEQAREFGRIWIEQRGGVL